jgi:hypothetical protein
MVILIALSIPKAFLNELNSLAALVLVRRADFLSAFNKPQRDALAILFLNLHGRGIVVAEITLGACWWNSWVFSVPPRDENKAIALTTCATRPF